MTYSTDFKTYSATFETETKEPLFDKLEELSEKAYAKNAYVKSEFHDLSYYKGYQMALKDVKESLAILITSGGL